MGKLVLKWICFFLFVAISFSRAWALSDAGDLEGILKRGTLVVAMPSFDFAQFFETDKEGNLHGYSISTARDIAKKLGVKLEFNRQANTFNGIVDVLASGGADVAICDLSKTLARGKRILYTDTDVILKNGFLISQVWLAKVQRNPLVSISREKLFDANNFKVAVLKESSYYDFITSNFPRAKLLVLDDTNSGVNALLQGKVDALVWDDLQIKMLLRKNPELSLKFQPLFFDDDTDMVAMAVPEGKFIWRDWLNLYLELRHKGCHGHKFFTVEDLLKDSG